MYGLIGYPLGHSFSAKYFAEKFLIEDIHETYKLFPIPRIDNLEGLIIENPDLRGLNVTIPYKKSVMDYLNSISEDAKAIGAVNVVKISRQEKDRMPYLSGYNTDWEGFSTSLRPLLRSNIKKALILGTGGASAAVAYALKRLGIEYAFVSRNAKDDAIPYRLLDKDIISEHLLIVNTTPLGMYPDISSCPDIPYEFLTSSHICYDLVYNPEITEFMRKASLKGATVKNGLEMLFRQAELSWEIWNGR